MDYYRDLKTPSEIIITISIIDSIMEIEWINFVQEINNIDTNTKPYKICKTITSKNKCSTFHLSRYMFFFLKLKNLTISETHCNPGILEDFCLCHQRKISQPVPITLTVWNLDRGIMRGWVKINNISFIGILKDFNTGPTVRSVFKIQLVKWYIGVNFSFVFLYLFLMFGA